MNALLGQVNKSVENKRVQDQTEEKSGFTREPIPESKGYPSRFIGYVEVGDRKSADYQGQKKPNARKAYLYFQLLSKKVAQEIEVDGVKKTIYPIHREMVDVKTGEKANLTKLFKRMAAGRSHLTHIAQMLGEPFKTGIAHNVKGEGADKKIYENARTKDDGWLISPPVVEVLDDDGEPTTKVLNVAEARDPIRLLLWDDPSPEQWESIKMRPYQYGEGDNKKTFDGGHLQFECINNALDFEGSALQAMLAGSVLPDMDVVDSSDSGDSLEDTGDIPDETEGTSETVGDADAEDLGLSDIDDEIPF